MIKKTLTHLRQPAPEGGKCGAVAMWGLWRHCWGHVRNSAVWKTAFTPGDGFNSSSSSFSSFLWGENQETLCRVEPSPRWTLGRAMYGNVGAIRSDGAMLGHSWDILACWAMWGPGWAMCVWTLYWSMLGPSWGHVGPCGSCVGAIWGQRWAKLEFSETMLHNCVTAQEKNICYILLLFAALITVE